MQPAILSGFYGALASTLGKLLVTQTSIVPHQNIQLIADEQMHDHGANAL